MKSMLSMLLKGPYTLLLLLSATGFGICQSDSLSIKAIYEKEVIYFRGNKYVKNEIKYPLRELANELKENTEAYHLYQSYKADYRKANIIFAAGLLLTVVAIPVLNNNYDAGIGLFTGVLISDIVSVRLMIRADRKLKKAIWLRNRDVLIR